MEGDAAQGSKFGSSTGLRAQERKGCLERQPGTGKGPRPVLRGKAAPLPAPVVLLLMDSYRSGMGRRCARDVLGCVMVILALAAHRLDMRQQRPGPNQLSRPRPAGSTRRWVAGVLGLLALSAFAHAEPPPAAATPPNEHGGLDTVTVEARRRKELEHEVDHFVNSVTGHPWGESAPRWNEKICPLVAGLPQTEGEFVLARLSQIAQQVHAPLAGEQCEVNFYVVLTHEPHVLLKKWYARDKRMFATRNGRGAINSFLDSPRPVRVWYNSDLLAEGGILDSPNASTAGFIGTGIDKAHVPTNTVHSTSRLRFGAVLSLSSVIVVVDANRLEGLNFGQLADYVAMIGLAQVRLDADLGATPTILSLFRSPQNRPAALSTWDEAFLTSLYRTEQSNVTQLSNMERSMLDSIAP